MLSTTIRQAWDALIVHPTLRLGNDFPWSAKRMARQYFTAVFLFLLGSLLPIVLMYGALFFLEWCCPATMESIVGEENERLELYLVVIPSIISFCTGFGAEIFYISRCLHREGKSLSAVMGMNLKSLGGSFWAAIWRALVVFVLIVLLDMIIESFLPAPYDRAAEFARGLSGLSFVVFGMLTAIGAPIFEEVVFRGFLFNGVRVALREGRGRLACALSSEKTRDWAAIAISAAVFAGAHWSLTGFPELFMRGCLLAALYRRSGSLIPPILVHILNNTAGIMALALASYA